MRSFRVILLFLFSCLMIAPPCLADLGEIKARGELRRLGVPYANFVTGDGDGLDARILKMYSEGIGVKYRYEKTDWGTVIGDLSGKKFVARGDNVEFTDEVPMKGDIIGNGLTFIPWREKIINFSNPYFPSAIRVVDKADSPVKPIQPTSDPKKDVEVTRDLLKGREVLGIKNTCGDLDLYNLKDSKPFYMEGVTLNDLAAVLIKGAAEISILDVPDSLVALSMFSGKIKGLWLHNRKAGRWFWHFKRLSQAAGVVQHVYGRTEITR